MIQFLLNNRLVTETALDPNMTVLNYLRSHQQRRGTKEGCASGDCGACTVTLGKVVAGRMQYQAINSCREANCRRRLPWRWRAKSSACISSSRAVVEWR